MDMSGAAAPVLYHLVQQSLWEKAVAGDETYYPPTYQQVGVGGGGEERLIDGWVDDLIVSSWMAACWDRLIVTCQWLWTHTQIGQTGRIHARDGGAQVFAGGGQPLLHW